MNGLNLAQDLACRLRGHWRRSLVAPLWGRSAILVLPRVVDDEATARLPHRAPWCLGRESFERLLLSLSDIARVVSLATVMQPHHQPQACIALTFDGAWRDDLDAAMPLLDHYALPASVFVSSGQLQRARGDWRAVIGDGLWQGPHARRIHDALGDAGLPLPPAPPAQRDTAYSRALRGYLQQLAGVAAHRLEAVTDYLTIELDLPPPHIDPFSIRRLENEGLIRFGTRGIGVAALEGLDDDAIRRQVRRSRLALARLCREPLPVFAYPDRNPSARVRRIVRECGVTIGLARQGGWLSHRDDPLSLPRIPLSQPLAQSPGRLFDYLLGQL
ncbi:polysaccharide deacetylase family protein [Modicisalibacter coralii]|uniref:polysaccharide deacetylase family protein n=1 Tax=Modicisalibacter coralii TaxID=2304602 RepID=UPI00100B8C50|nr:polysaccharide deacetylase family protein [Halomonas coralii]